MQPKENKKRNRVRHQHNTDDGGQAMGEEFDACINLIAASFFHLCACFMCSSAHVSTLHPLLAHHHLYYVDVNCVCFFLCIFCFFFSVRVLLFCFCGYCHWSVIWFVHFLFWVIPCLFEHPCSPTLIKYDESGLIWKSFKNNNQQKKFEQNRSSGYRMADVSIF